MIGQLTASPADVISPQLLSKPPMVVMGGSARGSITTGMFDCGLANQTCLGAEGRICLIQRGGGVRFCNKVLNCLAAGGLAAVIYGSDGDSECQMLFASLSCDAKAATGGQGWPIVLTAARAQGHALRNALAANPGMVVTLDAGSGAVALELLSGTSMSTAIAAGECWRALHISLAICVAVSVTLSVCFWYVSLSCLSQQHRFVTQWAELSTNYCCCCMLQVLLAWYGPHTPTAQQMTSVQQSQPPLRTLEFQAGMFTLAMAL
jgi:hypothetical protein